MGQYQNKVIQLIISAVVALTFGGCSYEGQPRARLGSYATSTPGTKFLGLHDLGQHHYDNPLFENSGIVYTCRGGHIDIAHLRIGADYTRYLYELTRTRLLKDDTDFTFRLNVEPSRYYVKILYPSGWDKKLRSEKERIVNEVSLELSQYFAFTMTTWHEILTFYGYKCMYVVPEEPSAFSWEDIYSNLLGIRLGAQALQDRAHDYDEAMTSLLDKEMKKLGIQSAQTAWQAAENMRGKWFRGYVLVDMIARNMDIGTDDGYVTPVLAPGICADTAPLSYPAPTLDQFNAYGFLMAFEVQPAEFEKDQILRIIYPNGGGSRIRFPDDLVWIMDYTKAEAIRRGCVITHMDQ